MQLQLLLAEIGAAGSGMVRYAAAMFFYKKGMMSADLLEIYRCCSKADNEDPVDLARYEGVAISPSLVQFIGHGQT